jgi:alkanesulfonate monooxygenase SsuD/methylene tetrahydromethanopterin reductase-like flavin-dependent oxidoreductase (luciferase family)
MRFSVWPTNQQPLDDLLRICRHTEADGWDGAWIADHLMPSADPLDRPVVECWTTVTAVAALIPRIRVGTLVSPLTYRHPTLLAKMAANVADLSGGRLVLGIGAGWQENEHQANGIPLPPMRDRLQRLDEGCAIIRRLLAGEVVVHSSPHFTLNGAVVSPLPHTPVPLLLGVKGEQTGLRIAARHADEWNAWGTPETFRHKSAVLDRFCADLDRDPASIKRSAQALIHLSPGGRGGRPDMPSIVGGIDDVRTAVAEFAAAGLDELVVPDFTFGTLEQKLDTLGTLMSRVVTEFR